jgi:hypothetical protein
LVTTFVLIVPETIKVYDDVELANMLRPGFDGVQFIEYPVAPPVKSKIIGVKDD